MTRTAKTSFLLEIPGVIPSKKNSTVIIKMGERYTLGLTKEYREWQSSFPWLARAQFETKYGDEYNFPFTCDLMMILRIWPKDLRKDTINALAGIADALEWHKDKNPNGLYKNDRQIISAQIIFVEVDKYRPRFTVEIGLIDNGQTDLF